MVPSNYSGTLNLFPQLFNKEKGKLRKVTRKR